MLDHGAHRGDAPDIVEAGADDILRMGEDQPLDAAPLRLLEHEPGFADVQVAARQDHVVPGDHVEHVLDAVQHLLVGVEHRHRRRGRIFCVEAGCDQLGRLLPAQMIFGGQCRHPDDLAAHRSGMFDRVGVDAADHIVEHDAGEDLGAAAPGDAFGSIRRWQRRRSRDPWSRPRQSRRPTVRAQARDDRRARGAIDGPLCTCGSIAPFRMASMRALFLSVIAVLRTIGGERVCVSTIAGSRKPAARA